MPKLNELAGTVTDGLKRKIGPMPAWAWGVTAAAGIWVVRAMRSGSSSARPQPSASSVSASSSLLPSATAGGGAPTGAPITSFAAPDDSVSPLYVSTLDFAIEGDPGSVLDVIDALTQQTTTSQGDPTGQPASDYDPAGNQPPRTQGGTVTLSYLLELYQKGDYTTIMDLYRGGQLAGYEDQINAWMGV